MAEALVALTETSGEEKSGLAGATEPSQASQVDVKGKIIEYAWWMKKQGYSDVTIRVNVSTLKTLINRGEN